MVVLMSRQFIDGLLSDAAYIERENILYYALMIAAKEAVGETDDELLDKDYLELKIRGWVMDAMMGLYPGCDVLPRRK